MAVSRAPRSRTCNRMSRRATVVRHSSGQWAARGRPFRRRSLSGIRDGGSHGPSRRRQLQQPLLSGSQSLVRRTSRSIPRLRLSSRSRRRRLRARYHQRHHRPKPPRRPRLLQHPRGRPAPKLTPPLQRRHRRLQTLQTMPCSKRPLRSTKPFQCGPPRRRLPPLNDVRRLNDQAHGNCRPAPRLRTPFAGRCGQRRPRTSPRK